MNLFDALLAETNIQFLHRQKLRLCTPYYRQHCERGESTIFNGSDFPIDDWKIPTRLSWTHYRIILQESNKEAREWYELKSVIKNMRVVVVSANVCLLATYK